MPNWGFDLVRTISLLSATVILIVASIAHADVAAVCAPDVTLRRATMDYQGYPGIWFARPIADCMLTQLEATPILRERVSLLEERIRLDEEQFLDLDRARGIAVEGMDALSRQLTTAIADRNEAQRLEHVWWRSPSTWFLVGTLFTAAALGLSFLLLR